VRVEVLAKSEVVSLTKPNIFFIVGIVRGGNKNIKRCTSLIKLAFLVFQNLTLNCGLFKSTLLIPSQVDFFFHL